MAEALKRFISRAPRYVIRPEDRQAIRFASPQNREKSFTTMIVNVSQSGMAFRVDKELKPELGESIMIEFTVPGAQQMACHARVVRVEEYYASRWQTESEEVVVAVKFIQLRRAHEENLKQGLHQKFKKLQTDVRKQQFLGKINWAWSRRSTIALISFWTIVLGLVFYFVAQPRGTYQPSTDPIPFGSREF